MSGYQYVHNLHNLWFHFLRPYQIQFNDLSIFATFWYFLYFIILPCELQMFVFFLLSVYGICLWLWLTFSTSNLSSFIIFDSIFQQHLIHWMLHVQKVCLFRAKAKKILQHQRLNWTPDCKIQSPKFTSMLTFSFFRFSFCFL